MSEEKSKTTTTTDVQKKSGQQGGFFGRDSADIPRMTPVAKPASGKPTEVEPKGNASSESTQK